MKGTKETERGNKYILAIINNFSGYMKLYEVSQPDAKTTASKVMDYINVNSMPLRIISDNGTEFSNELMQELGLLLGLKQTFITAYNSKSNGKVENLHKTVQRMIRSFIENFKTSWDLLLPYLEFAINTSKSEVTTYTPFFIHFGRHLNYPVDTFYGTIYQPVMTTNEYVKILQKNRDIVFEWIRNYKQAVAKEQAMRYDKHYANVISEIPIGQYVVRL
jgi:hypothetical protein